METQGSEFLSAAELSRRSNLSLSTINRLRAAGKIPFYQPGGKGSRVLFPSDAIEQSSNSETIKLHNERVEPTTTIRPEKLAGPQPKWMSINENNQHAK